MKPAKERLRALRIEMAASEKAAVEMLQRGERELAALRATLAGALEANDALRAANEELAARLRGLSARQRRLRRFKSMAEQGSAACNDPSLTPLPAAASPGRVRMRWRRRSR